VLGSVVALGLSGLAEAVPPRDDMVLGVTYSPRYAGGLGLDQHAVYIRMLDELRLTDVRLPLYWEEVEPAPGVYDFSEVDFYLREAEARGVRLLLSLGYKQPRWPECYPPAWAVGRSAEQLQSDVLGLVEAEVRHAAPLAAVGMWQVENEPFVSFGNCAEPVVLTPAFVNEEIALIHRLDHRPVLLTDSGEWSTLLETVATPGVHVGLSVYRDVPMTSFGMTRYPLPAWSYRAKEWLARTVTGTRGLTIISELQCEPWFEGGGLREVPYELQRSQFPPEDIVDSNVQYARRTGFTLVYLWGAEWWYWMAAEGHPEYVAEAQRVFAGVASN
jgi:hypothetical protein